MENELVVYEDGEIELSVPTDGETVWFTQRQIAELFGMLQQSVSRSLATGQEKGVLGPEDVQQFVVKLGPGRPEKHYSLEAAMYVGLRANSPRAAHLQKWAIKVLRDHLIEGITLNARRLSVDRARQKDVADRIRQLRLANAFQELSELLREAGREADTNFMPEAMMAYLQNDIYRAITGKTAAGLLVERCDHRLSNCGIVHTGRPTTAKNYLLESELRQVHMVEEAFLEAIAQRIQRGLWEDLNPAQLNKILHKFLEAYFGSSPLCVREAGSREAKLHVAEQLSLFYQNQLREETNETS